ncbi:SRPBCC family protein [Actinoallomurus sp. CA-150999]|uniref:SRPBCC family protein n=1 Tax=Actinoallomurus sp. CA-150999 TaxID=3239887 RepID=UPI003D89F155
MIFSEMKLPANPPGLALLTRDQIWEGLEQKALDAVPYVAAIAECREIARQSDTVFDRELQLGGARYVERVWLEASNRIVFARLDGPVLGTITNEILEEGGELSLRFQFALVIRPGDTLPVTEQELSAQMVSAYQAAVESTLAAVRTRLATAEATR